MCQEQWQQSKQTERASENQLWSELDSDFQEAVFCDHVEIKFQLDLIFFCLAIIQIGHCCLNLGGKTSRQFDTDI